MVFSEIKLKYPFLRSQGDMTVVLGAHDLSKQEKSQQKIKVAKFCPHPQFKGKFDFDIMLLKVNKLYKFIYIIIVNTPPPYLFI